MYIVYSYQLRLILDAVGSSGILKGKQNLDITFNFDKQDAIDFTKFSKMTGPQSKFIKGVVGPLFFGQKNYKGLLFY